MIRGGEGIWRVGDRWCWEVVGDRYGGESVGRAWEGGDSGRVVIVGGW